MVTVFWGGREGYQSLLNTDVAGEASHMASFFKMAVGKIYFAQTENIKNTLTSPMVAK